MPSESVRMISKRSSRSACMRYSVPPSALVICLAATRIASSRRLMSFSRDSAMPIRFSSVSRRNRSASFTSFMVQAFEIARACAREPLLDADRAHLVHVGDALQHLLHAVLLQRAHAVVERGRHDLRYARMLLDQLLDQVAAEQQLV